MSDTGGHTSSSSPQQPVAGPRTITDDVVTRRSRQRQLQQQQHHQSSQAPWTGSNLDDIRMAIEQLTLRSHASTSTYSSLSSASGSGPRRPIRQPSLETLHTSATSADEFVWLEARSRLVELRRPPWAAQELGRVLGRELGPDAATRLSLLLQRALVRIGQEARRLSRPLGLCARRQIAGALKVILGTPLADACSKACLRAAAMYALAPAGTEQLRRSKAERAGLRLSVGRFLRWMADARLGRMVHEYAAVYLTAAVECLLEELVARALPAAGAPLTAALLDHAVATSPEFWGLLQPYAHLNAGRTASGALALPRSISANSVNSNSSTGQRDDTSASTSLLTTCVGSEQELLEIMAKLGRAGHAPLPLSSKARHALFYYMRCSQVIWRQFLTIITFCHMIF